MACLRDWRVARDAATSPLEGRVLVVGAGASGLTAAKTLAEAGADQRDRKP